jgi:CRISPR-associated protein Csx10
LERGLPQGIRLQLASPDSGLLSHLLRARRTEGWHQGWGLPRPSYVGIAAGSCAVFEVAEGCVTGADLQSLMHQGLGERRGEGFGEVAINDPLLMAGLAGMQTSPVEEQVRRCCPVQILEQRGDAAAHADLDSGPAADYLSGLRLVALRERLKGAVRIQAADPGFRARLLHWKGREPGNSQLGNLRGVLGRLRGAEGQGEQEVLRWIGSTRKKGGGWPGGALDAVAELIRDRDLIWTWLEITDDPVREPLFAGLSPAEVRTLKSGLRAKAIRALFAASIHAEVRERERKQGAQAEGQTEDQMEVRQ